MAKSNLKIFHGKYDGCVPVSQSVDFYLELSKHVPDYKDKKKLLNSVIIN